MESVDNSLLHIDPVLWAPFAFIILVNVAVLWYLRRLYNRLVDLRDSGLTANATILMCKPFSTKGGRMLRLEYEFRTMGGEARAGRTNVAYSEEAVREYGVGKTFPVLYSQAINYSHPAKNIPAALKAMARANKIMPLIIIANVFMIYYLLSFHHTHFRKHY